MTKWGGLGMTSGVMLPAQRPRFLPGIKALASAMAFVFAFTSVLPSGWAQQPARPADEEHLRGLSGEEAPGVKAGLEEALKGSDPIGSDPTGVGVSRRGFIGGSMAAVALGLLGFGADPQGLAAAQPPRTPEEFRAAMGKLIPDAMLADAQAFANARKVRGAKLVVPDMRHIPKEVLERYRKLMGEEFRGFDFNGFYVEYASEGPKHPDHFLTDHGRTWIYTQALVLYDLIGQGRQKEARELAGVLVRLGRQLEALGFQSGWHFSYNTNFEEPWMDPRAPTGNTLWAMSALYAYMIRFNDLGHLDWTNRLMERMLSLQVMDPKDTRYGLIQAMRYNARLDQKDPKTGRLNSIDLIGYFPFEGDFNRAAGDIATEHQFDAINTLRLAFLVNEAAPEKTRPARGVSDTWVTRHRLLMENVTKLWVTDHFVTGMTPEGLLVRGTDGNPSIAVDNNSWASVILPYNQEMAWAAIQYVRDRFLPREQDRLRVGEMQGLPPETQRAVAANPKLANERVPGLYFFTPEFNDRFIEGIVPPGDADRKAWAEMIQPEATFGFIDFLVRFAQTTADAKKRAEAQRLAEELLRGMVRLHELYGRGGLPYAVTKRKPVKLFSTLRSVTATSTGSIVLRGIRNAAASRNFLMVPPPAAMMKGVVVRPPAKPLNVAPARDPKREARAGVPLMHYAGADRTLWTRAAVEAATAGIGVAAGLEEKSEGGLINRRTMMGLTAAGGAAAVIAGLTDWTGQPAEQPGVPADGDYAYMTSSPPGEMVRIRRGGATPVFGPSQMAVLDTVPVSQPDGPELGGIVTELEPAPQESYVRTDVVGQQAHRDNLTPTTHRPVLPIERILPALTAMRLAQGQQLIAGLAVGTVDARQWQAVRQPGQWIAPPGKDLVLTLHDGDTLENLREAGSVGAGEVEALVESLDQVKQAMGPRRKLWIAREIHDLVTGWGHEVMVQDGQMKLTKMKDVPPRVRRTLAALQRKGVKVAAMGSGTDWVLSPFNFEPGVNHLLAALNTGLFDRERLYLDLEVWTKEIWTRAWENWKRTGEEQYHDTLLLLARLWIQFHEDEVLKKVVPGRRPGRMGRDQWADTQVHTFVTPEFLEIVREEVEDRRQPLDPRITPVLMPYKYPPGQEAQEMQRAVDAEEEEVELAVNLTPSADEDLSGKTARQLQQILRQVRDVSSFVINVRETAALIQLLRDGQLSGAQTVRLDDQTLGSVAEGIALSARQAVGLPATRSEWEQQARPIPRPPAEDIRKFAESGGLGLFWGVIGAAPLFHLPNTLVRWLRNEFGFHPDTFPGGPEGGTLLKVIGHILGVLANGRVTVERADLIVYEVDGDGKRIPGTEREPHNVLGVSSPLILPAGKRYAGQVRLTLRRVQLPLERVRESLRERLGRAPSDEEIQAMIREMGWDGALTVVMSTQVTKGHQASGDTPREHWERIDIPAGAELYTKLIEVPVLDPGPNWITHRTFDINGEVTELLGSGTNLMLTSQYARALAHFHLAWLESRREELGRVEPEVRAQLTARLGRAPTEWELEDELRWDLRIARQVLKMNEWAIRSGSRGDIIARVPFEEVRRTFTKSEALRDFEAEFEFRNLRAPTDEELRAAGRDNLVNERAALARLRAQLELRFWTLKASGVTGISVQIPQAMQREFWERLIRNDLNAPMVDTALGHEITGLGVLAHQFGIRIGVEMDTEFVQQMMQEPDGVRREQTARDRGLRRDSMSDLLRLQIEANEKRDWNLDSLSLRLPSARDGAQRQQQARLREVMEIFFEGRDMDLVLIGPRGPQAVSNWRSQYAAEVANPNQMDEYFDTAQPEKPERQRFAHAVVLTGPSDGTLESLVRQLSDLPTLGRGSAAQRENLKERYRQRLHVPSTMTLRRLGVRDPAKIAEVQAQAGRASHLELKEALDRSAFWAVATVQALAQEAGQAASIHMVDRYGTFFDRGLLQAHGARPMPLIYTQSERPDVLPLNPPVIFRRADEPALLGVKIKNQGTHVVDLDVYIVMSHPYDQSQPAGRNNWPGSVRHVTTVRLEPGEREEVWWKVNQLPATPDDVEYRVVVLPRGSELIRPGMPSTMINDFRALARTSGRIVLGSVEDVPVSDPAAEIDLLRVVREMTQGFFDRERREVRLGFTVSRAPPDRLRRLNEYLGGVAEYELTPAGSFRIRQVEGTPQINRDAWKNLPRKVEAARERIRQAAEAGSPRFLVQIPEQPPSEGIARLQGLVEWLPWILGGLAGAWGVSALVEGYRKVRARRAAAAARARQQQRLQAQAAPTQPPAPAPPTQPTPPPEEPQASGLEEQVPGQPIRPAVDPKDITSMHSIKVGGPGMTATAIPVGENPEPDKVVSGAERSGKGTIGTISAAVQKLSENILRKPLSFIQRVRRKFFGAITTTIAAAIGLPFWLIAFQGATSIAAIGAIEPTLGTLALSAGVAGAAVLAVIGAWWLLARSPGLQRAVGWALEQPGRLWSNGPLNTVFGYASGVLFPLLAFKLLGVLGIPTVTLHTLPVLGVIGLPSWPVALIIGGIVLLGLVVSRVWEDPYRDSVSRAFGAAGVGLIGAAGILKLALMGWAIGWWGLAFAVPVIVIGIITFRLMFHLEGAPKPLEAMAGMVGKIAGFLLKWGTILGAGGLLIFKVVNPFLFGLWEPFAGAGLATLSLPVMIALAAVTAIVLYYRFEIGRTQIQMALGEMAGRPETELAARNWERILRGVVAVGAGWLVLTALTPFLALLGLPATVGGFLVGVLVLSVSLYMVNKAMNALELGPTGDTLLKKVVSTGPLLVRLAGALAVGGAGAVGLFNLISMIGPWLGALGLWSWVAAVGFWVLAPLAVLVGVGVIAAVVVLFLSVGHFVRSPEDFLPSDYNTLTPEKQKEAREAAELQWKYVNRFNRFEAWWQVYLIVAPIGMVLGLFAAAAASSLSGPVTLAIVMTYIFFLVMPGLLSWSAFNTYVLQPGVWWIQRQFEKKEEREQTLRYAISWLHGLAGLRGVAVTVPAAPGDIPAKDLEALFDQLAGALNMAAADKHELLSRLSRRRRSPSQRPQQVDLYNPDLLRQAWTEARARAQHHRVEGFFPDVDQGIPTEDQMRLINWRYWKLVATRQAIEWLWNNTTGAAARDLSTIPAASLSAEFFKAARAYFGITADAKGKFPPFTRNQKLDLRDLLGSHLAEHLKAHSDIIFNQDDGTVARTFWSGFATGKFSPLLHRFRNDDRLEVLMPALILSFGWDTDYTKALLGWDPKAKGGKGDWVAGWSFRREGISAWLAFPLEILRVGLLSYAVPIGFYASMVNRNLRSTFQPGNTLNTMVVSADAGVQGYLRILGWVKDVMGRWLVHHIGVMGDAYQGKRTVSDPEEALGWHRAEAKHGTLKRHIDRLLELAGRETDPQRRHDLYAAAAYASLRGGGTHPRNVFFDDGKAALSGSFTLEGPRNESPEPGWVEEVDGQYWGEEFNKGLLDVVAIRFDRPTTDGTTLYTPTGIELDEATDTIGLTNHPERYVLKFPTTRYTKDVLSDGGLSFLEGYFNTQPVKSTRKVKVKGPDGKEVEEVQPSIRIDVISEESRIFPELEEARRAIQAPEGPWHDGDRRKEGTSAGKVILKRQDQRVRKKLAQSDAAQEVTATVQTKVGLDMYERVWGQRWLLVKNIARIFRELFLGFRLEKVEVTEKVNGVETPVQRTKQTWSIFRALPAWAAVLAGAFALVWGQGLWLPAVLLVAVPVAFGAVWGGLNPLSFYGGGIQDPVLQGMKGHYDPEMLDGAMRELFGGKVGQMAEVGRVDRRTYALLIQKGWDLVKSDPELVKRIRDYPRHIDPEHPLYKYLRGARAGRVKLGKEILARVEPLIAAKPDPERPILWRAFYEMFRHNAEMELLAIGNVLAEILYHGSRHPGVIRGGDVNTRFGLNMQDRELMERLMAVLDIPALADRTWQRSSAGAYQGGLRIPSFADEKEAAEFVRLLKANEIELAWRLMDSRRLPIEVFLEDAQASGYKESPAEYALRRTHLQPDLATVDRFLVEESKELAERSLPDFIVDESQVAAYRAQGYSVVSRQDHARWLEAEQSRRGEEGEPYLQVGPEGMDLRPLKDHLKKHGDVRLTNSNSVLRRFSEWMGEHPILAEGMTLSRAAMIGAGIAAVFGGGPLLLGGLLAAAAPAILHTAAGLLSWAWRSVRGQPYSQEAVTLQKLFGVRREQLTRDWLTGSDDLEYSSLDGLFDAGEWMFAAGTYAFPGSTIARMPVKVRRGTRVTAAPVPFIAAVRLLMEPDGLAQASGFNWLPTDAFRNKKGAEDTEHGNINDHTPRGNPTMNASGARKKQAIEGKQELRKKDKAPNRAIQLFKGMAMEQAVRHLFDHPIFQDVRKGMEDRWRENEARRQRKEEELPPTPAEIVQQLFGWDSETGRRSTTSIFGLEAYREDEVIIGGARFGAGTFLYGYTGNTGNILYGRRVGPFTPGDKDAYWAWRTHDLLDSMPTISGEFLKSIRRAQQALQQRVNPAAGPLDDQAKPEDLLKSYWIDPFAALADQWARQKMGKATQQQGQDPSEVKPPDLPPAQPQSSTPPPVSPPAQTQAGPSTTQLGAGLEEVEGLRAAVGQEIGGRSSQQDSFLVRALGRSDEKPLALLAIVADGMGGVGEKKNEGARASRLVVERLDVLLKSEIFLGQLQEYRDPATEPGRRQELDQAIQNNMELAVREPNVEIHAFKGGTTVVAAVVVGSRVFIASVGDSRAYLLREGVLEPLTEDASLMWDLEKEAAARESGSAAEPSIREMHRRVRESTLDPQLRSTLFQYVGTPWAPEVETYGIDVKPGDRLLLVTDGVWGLLPDDVMEKILSSQGISVGNIVQNFLDAAALAAKNKGRGGDNRTALVIEAQQIPEAPAPPATPPATETSLASPVASAVPEAPAPAPAATETRLAEVATTLQIQELPEVRVAVISYTVAAAHPELAGFIGRGAVRLGRDTWAIFLPQVAEADEIVNLLAPILLDDAVGARQIRFWSYYIGQKDDVLKMLESVATSSNVPVTDVPVGLEAELPGLVRQILANLRNVSEPEVTDDEIRLMVEALPSFV